MARIRLMHSRAAEAARYIDALRAAGLKVEYDEKLSLALLKRFRESPPDAFVIDLSRLPSHGREVAITLRQSPRTRQVPIVFCDGDEEKVEKVRAVLPDASYCTLAKLPAAVRKAMANRPANPVKPLQMMDRYAGRTAAQKLGVKPSSTLALIDAPRDALQAMGELPEGVEILDGAGAADVTLCFVRDAHSLLDMLSKVRKLAKRSKLWILWRKGGAAARGDVTEPVLRQTANDLGLVDYKICSVNAVWSAMLFASRG
jgi:CheY-like chemotaxis protein